MKFPAGKVPPGTIGEIVPGAVTSHPRTDLGGTGVTPAAPDAAVAERARHVGDPAHAAVRASAVTIGTD
ncbi:transporter (plasmid) [Paroceanicella profunda]|uniref:Transporter n=1 Tax=Paroceanicella profunda TaxID=2579971 RepID=A0A5B8G050_9RHOB|nr:transporter [Paroceanicella profunda]QDL94085.1 transporter [Paroceanicella profunda]